LILQMHSVSNIANLKIDFRRHNGVPSRRLTKPSEKYLLGTMVKSISTSARKILQEHGYHLFFAFSLFALLALAAWWSVFMIKAINERHENALEKLRYEARMIAAISGHVKESPFIGILDRYPGLEIAPATASSKNAFPLSPNWSGYEVRISHQKMEQIEKKFTRQKVMWIGEGSMLFLLILIGMFMLYRLVGVEHRYRAEMDRFLDLVTHELKTPLAGVRSLLQTIAMGRLPAESLPQVTGLGMKNIERLDHLVQNILVRNRLRHKKYILQNERIDLRECAQRTIDHRVEAGTSHMKPILDPGDNPQVLADRESLRVILDNLLDNAEKYGLGEKPIHVSIAGEKDLAVFAVIDSGTGIAPENLELVFNPFFRVQTRLEKTPRGSGLGLAICRDLVARMGGTIRAASDGLGRGARFEVRLPRSD
jgi:signal transduction histidine kinase